MTAVQGPFPGNQTNEPISLSDYAEHVGKSLRSVQRDVKARRIPAWRDPVTGMKVTSVGAISRVRQLAAQKAEKEFIQRAKLDR